MTDEEVAQRGAPILAITKPRTEAASKTKVQVNLRLTEYLRWKLYRYTKQQKIGQSEAVRRILSDFFETEDTESDWRAQKK